MDFIKLFALAEKAIAVAKMGQELVDQVADGIESAKEAMNTNDLTVLRDMLAKARVESKARHDALAAKLDALTGA